MIAFEQRPAIATADSYVRHEVARAGAHTAIIVAAYFVLPFGDSWLFGGVLAFAIVGLFPFTIRRFGRVLRSQHPLGDAVSALVLTLVTLVFSFASAYFVFASRHPESVRGLSTKIDALYFEMAMVSTVGFGDVSATSQRARFVATLNMLMNMVFLGASLRLLSWAVQRHRETDQPPTTDLNGP